MYFKMSSAICFNLDQFKILSSGNGFSPFCQGAALFYMTFCTGPRLYLRYLSKNIVENGLIAKFYIDKHDEKSSKKMPIN